VDTARILVSHRASNLPAGLLPPVPLLADRQAHLPSELAPMDRRSLFYFITAGTRNRAK
jgi:hypothetical protein